MDEDENFDSGTDALIQFMSEGNIRVMSESAIMTLFDKDNITDTFKMNAINNQLFIDKKKVESLPLNERGQSPNIVTKPTTSNENILLFKKKVNGLLEKIITVILKKSMQYILEL